MKDVEMAGKLIPPAVTRQILSSSRGPNQETSKEIECPRSNQDRSPPQKRKAPSEASPLDSELSFDATAAGGAREISMMLTKFAELLSDRAAADTTQVKELEGILTKARNLESCLKEQKNKLRQTLTQISDKLQS